MLGFAKLSNEVGIAFDAPAPEWNLKFLSHERHRGAAAAPPPAAAAPALPRQPPAMRPRPQPPSRPNPRRPRPGDHHGNRHAETSGERARRPGQRAARTDANGGRPSLVQAGGYQRVDVNSSGDQSAAPDTGLASNEMADLSSSADPSLLVNGSVSRGLDMPQQNDWFGGPGGRMDGMGGGPDGHGRHERQ